MKLLYITNGINGSGGLERVLSIKASALVEDYGYEVSILVLNNAHKEPFYKFSNNISFYSISITGNALRYFLSYKRGVQSVVDNVLPDIISVCDDGLKGFLLPSLIKTKARLIYERHASIRLNTGTGMIGSFIRLFMRRLAEKFDAFVVLTSANQIEWKTKNLLVIANPLTFDSKQGSMLQNREIIVVGSHSYNKGYDNLLKIWKTISEEFSDWQLCIYGKIDAEKVYVKMASRLKLKNILFFSPVADIKSKYLESSIMLLTSRSEGFGMVLIEAMSCGLPCISFDCPSGPRDIIIHEKNGFLIEDQNIGQFIEALAKLMNNLELRQLMGTHAQESTKRFDKDFIMKQWDTLFNHLIKKRTSRKIAYTDKER